MDGPQEYWGTNLPRLENIKAAIDPGDVFHNPQSVSPVVLAANDTQSSASASASASAASGSQTPKSGGVRTMDRAWGLIWTVFLLCQLMIS